MPIRKKTVEKAEEKRRSAEEQAVFLLSKHDRTLKGA